MPASKKKVAKKKVAKKKSTSKSVAKRSSQELAAFNDRLAQKAETNLQHESFGTGNRLTYNTGEFKIAGDAVGDELEVVIFDETKVNEFYGNLPYDKDNPMGPFCFSIGQDEGEMGPHENSTDPQSDGCQECPHNAFGSAQVGGGKACKNTRRLGIVSLESIQDGVDPSDAEIAIMSVAPTSITAFTSYKKKIAKMLNRPVNAVSTLLSLESVDNYYTIKFDLIEPLTIDEYDVVENIQEFSEDQMERPFQKSEQSLSDLSKGNKRAKTSKKKTTKKKAKRKF